MVSKEHKIILLLPPKTASTSLISNMVNSGVYLSNPKISITTPIIHLKLDEIIESYEINNLSDYKVIQMTRNPYSRIISSYFHQLRILDLQNNDNSKIIFKNYNFPEFISHLFLTHKSNDFIKDFYGDESFIEWSMTVNKTWGGSRFFQQQCSWRNLECNYYHFKLEDLLLDISPLSNLIGIKLRPLEVSNKNPFKTNYEKFLTNETNPLIQEIFLEDFKTFNY